MSTFISVILTAHNPTKHLLEALDSIHAQDLHYNLFEVLVIRDFEDEAFVRKISEYGFRDVLVDEDSFKGKVEVGLWESNGKVLTFMEDDDLWKTNRLSTIFSIFRDDNELVFYHNSHVPIDQKGNVLGRSMFYNIPTPHLVKPGPNYREEVNKVSKYNPDFNTSSMAVRKDHLISAENDFKQVIAGVDSFIYFSTVARSGKLLIDSRKLTFYRIHNSQTIRFDEYDKFMRKRSNKDLEKLNSYYKIYEMCQGSPGESHSKALFLEQKGKVGVLQAANGDKSLLLTIKEALFMFSYAFSTGKKYICVLIIWNFIFRFAPRLASKPYYRYRMREQGKIADV